MPFRQQTTKNPTTNNIKIKRQKSPTTTNVLLIAKDKKPYG